MAKKKPNKKTSKSTIKDFVAKNKKTIKFVSIFISILLVYFVSAGLFSNFFDKYINFTAWLTSKLMTLIGISAYANGNVIVSAKSMLSLSFGCEGTEPIIIFFAAVISFPVPIKKKLVGLIIGIPFLYFLNLIRIIGLHFVFALYPEMFETFHVAIFPVLFIIISIITFILWLRFLSKAKTV